MKAAFVLLVGLILALPGLAGCGAAAGAGNGGAASTAAKPLLQVLAIDEDLSRQAQSKTGALSQPLNQEIILRQLRRDDAGNLQRNYNGTELSVPWVLRQDPVISSDDVAGVSNPGTDSRGRPCVVISLTGDAAQRLTQPAAGQAGTSAKPAARRAAIVLDSEVKAIITLPSAAGDGTISFNCTSREALEIEARFSS